MSFLRHLCLVCLVTFVNGGLVVLFFWHKGHTTGTHALMLLAAVAVTGPLVALALWPLRQYFERLARAVLKRFGIPVRPESRKLDS